MNCACVGFIADALYLSLPLISEWLEWDIDMLDFFYYMWTSVSLNVLVKCIQFRKSVHFCIVCIMEKNDAHQQ
jgi:hypothetical protein